MRQLPAWLLALTLLRCCHAWIGGVRHRRQRRHHALAVAFSEDELSSSSASAGDADDDDDVNIPMALAKRQEKPDPMALLGATAATAAAAVSLPYLATLLSQEQLLMMAAPVLMMGASFSATTKDPKRLLAPSNDILKAVAEVASPTAAIEASQAVSGEEFMKTMAASSPSVVTSERQAMRGATSSTAKDSYRYIPTKDVLPTNYRYEDDKPTMALAPKDAIVSVEEVRGGNNRTREDREIVDEAKPGPAFETPEHEVPVLKGPVPASSSEPVAADGDDKAKSDNKSKEPVTAKEASEEGSISSSDNDLETMNNVLNSSAIDYETGKETTSEVTAGNEADEEASTFSSGEDPANAVEAKTIDDPVMDFSPKSGSSSSEKETVSATPNAMSSVPLEEESTPEIAPTPSAGIQKEQSANVPETIPDSKAILESNISSEENDMGAIASKYTELVSKSRGKIPAESNLEKSSKEATMQAIAEEEKSVLYNDSISGATDEEAVDPDPISSESSHNLQEEKLESKSSKTPDPVANHDANEKVATISKEEEPHKKGKSFTINVAVIGYKNAGKSTILNALFGGKYNEPEDAEVAIHRIYVRPPGEEMQPVTVDVAKKFQMREKVEEDDFPELLEEEVEDEIPAANQNAKAKRKNGVVVPTKQFNNVGLGLDEDEDDDEEFLDKPISAVHHEIKVDERGNAIRQDTYHNVDDENLVKIPAKSSLRRAPAPSLKPNVAETFPNERSYSIGLDDPLGTIRDDTELAFVDVPSLDEDGYWEFLQDNWKLFDCAVVVMDAGEDGDSDDRSDAIVKLLYTVAGHREKFKKIPVILVGNKVDDPEDPKQQEMTKHMRDLSIGVFGDSCSNDYLEDLLVETGPLSTLDHDDDSVVFIPLSAQRAGIYQLLNGLTEEEVALVEMDLIDKLAYEQVGRRAWTKIKKDPEAKQEVVFKAFQDPDEYREMWRETNFGSLRSILSRFVTGDVTQKSLLGKQLKVDFEELDAGVGVTEKFERVVLTSMVLGIPIQGVQEQYWENLSTYMDQSVDSMLRDFDASALQGIVSEMSEFHSLSCRWGWSTQEKMALLAMRDLVKQQMRSILVREHLSAYHTWKMQFEEIRNGSKGDLVPALPTWKNLSPYEWYLIIASFTSFSHSKYYCEAFGKEKVNLDLLMHYYKDKCVPTTMDLQYPMEADWHTHVSSVVMEGTYDDEGTFQPRNPTFYRHVCRFEMPELLSDPSHWGHALWTYCNLCEKTERRLLEEGGHASHRFLPEE